MTEHDRLRELLPLASAGVLDADEVRTVQQHVAACESCRKELDAWGGIAQGMRQLPQPTPPAGLVQQTQARILASRERGSEAVLAGLAVFGWSLSLTFWMLARVLTGGVVEVFGVNLVSGLWWSTGWTVVAWVSAGTAAAMLARHRAGRRVL